MTTNTAPISGDRSAILSYRRCIILAIVGSTPNSSPVLSEILRHGFLKTARQWLDDLLNKSIGGVDLLLHMLTNITNLPVTKSVVKDSGMGKAIGSLDKHKICAGTPNEAPIKQRTKLLKDAWNKSVKARKEAKPVSAGTKREVVAPTSPPVQKKAKTEKSSFSSLLKKVNSKVPPKVAAAIEKAESKSESHAGQVAQSASKIPSSIAGPNNKKQKRVKWSDHFGGNIISYLDGSAVEVKAEGGESSDLSDRRKRDRLREKELLAKAKRSKLMDDDDDDLSMNMASNVPTIKTTIAWHALALLPALEDAAPPQVNSLEVATQSTRIASAVAARYFEGSVPSNPAPLSDVEQALDMASQTSAVLQPIPFFAPQAPAPEPAPAPAPQPTSYAPPPPVNPPPPGNMGMPPQSNHSAAAATPEIVQSLGLPMFLVGQNVQALETLARNPTLLGTFVDGNGMYDQARITSLVQTLTQNIAPTQQQGGTTGGYQQPTPSSSYGSGMSQQYGSSSGGGAYGPPSGGYGQSQQGQSHYGSGWQQGGGGAPRTGGFQARTSTEGNLHLSGYGPGTTQAEIIALFSQYVQVDEVVMKGTFCFVNTSDPEGAKNARESLTGALLGGSPVRINMAQRKNRDGASSSFHSNTSSYGGNTGNAGMNGMGNMGMYGQSSSVPGVPSMQSQTPMAQGENVRDDRGNPATKNLFVAGYGAGTSEHLIRETFGQHCTIIGIIMKGSFSFVNTSDRMAAIQTRQALSGTMLNGGVLRINFAKETGRLGTSFDLTYGGAGGPGPGGGGGGGASSHYGRPY